MTIRLLLVEDNAASLFAMLDYFGADGFAVDGVRSLRQAKVMLAARPYACVITDLRLGLQVDEDGLEVAAVVKSVQPAVPVILLSAYSSPAVAERAREVGVVAVLSKPAPLPEVARLVRRSIDRTGGDA